MYFRNYGLRKTWLFKYLKKWRFRGSFDNQHGKRAQTLFNILINHACIFCCILSSKYFIDAVPLTFYFLSTLFIAFLLLLTFKGIQRRVLVGLEPLRRNPQFASSFIYPKCQTNALLLLF